MSNSMSNELVYHRSTYRLKPQEKAGLIQSAERCAIFKSVAHQVDHPSLPDNWWVSYSPEQYLHAAEGTWQDWVKLAKMILEADKINGKKEM